MIIFELSDLGVEQEVWDVELWFVEEEVNYCDMEVEFQCQLFNECVQVVIVELNWKQVVLQVEVDEEFNKEGFILEFIVKFFKFCVDEVGNCNCIECECLFQIEVVN